MQTNPSGPAPAIDPRPILRQTIDGWTIVSVPVRGGGYARLDGPTADLLKASGLSFVGWYLGRTRVGDQANVCAPSRNPDRYPVLVVARLIVGATPGQRVRYRNGDRCDLTRVNLRAESRVKSARLLESAEVA